MIISVWYLVTFFPEMGLLLYLYLNEPKLKEPKKSKPTGDNIIIVLAKGWKLYFQKDIFFASLAYVTLWFTVLTPGTLMPIWLKTQKFQDLAIGGFRALCAFTGVLVTFITPYLIQKMGTVYTGLFAIFAQVACLCVAVLFISISTEMWSLYIFLVAIIFSRMGLWVFTLAEMEIMQRGIPEEERGVVNAVEKACCTIAFSSILLLGTIVNNPAHFYYLIVVSFDGILIGTASYLIFVYFYGKKYISSMDTKTEEVFIVEEEEMPDSKIFLAPNVTDTDDHDFNTLLHGPDNEVDSAYIVNQESEHLNDSTNNDDPNDVK